MQETWTHQYKPHPEEEGGLRQTEASRPALKGVPVPAELIILQLVRLIRASEPLTAAEKGPQDETRSARGRSQNELLDI